MTKNILVAALLLLAMNMQVQAQQLREYIGTPDRSEVILDTKAMPDGGAVMVGYSTVFDASNNYDYTQTDLLALRVDANGTVMWNRRMGVPNLEDFFKSVIIASNGDIIAVGYVGHVPWGIPSPNAGAGVIYRLDANLGFDIQSNFLTNGSGNSNDKGAIFNSVIELDNGNFVVTGARDAQPAWSDGLVACFDPTLAVQWSTTFLITNTDEAMAVTQDNNRIFVGAGYYSTTFYDLNLAELDPTSGAIVWSKTMAYTFTKPETSVTYTNNTIDEIKVVNNELYILTMSINNFGATGGGMAGILRTDLSGNFLSLHHYNHPTDPHNYLASVDYENANTAYYVINPGPSSMNLHAPVTGPLVVQDAQLAIVDPVTGVINDTRRLIHTGNQSLISTSLLGNSSHWAGTAQGDPQQISTGAALDVFYIRGMNGLPNNLTDCEALDGNIVSAPVPVTESPFSYSINQLWTSPSPNIVDYVEDLQVNLLCMEEPCEVEDITWCSSKSAPLTYNFGVVTNPPGSNVVWNFPSGPVASTAGTNVPYTFASPGSYNICVDVINAAGEVCATECIDICISDVPRKKATRGNTTMSVPVNEDKTILGDMYPNPTDGSLNIPVTTKLASTDVTVRIIRMDGVVVHNTKTRIERGKQVLSIELSNLAPGNYMCEIRDGETISVKPFVKN